MDIRRSARRHLSGLDADLSADFAIGDRVLTPEGITGSITSRDDGPFPQTETYEVLLDQGLGGGTYSAEELTSIPGAGSIQTQAEKVAVELPEPTDDPNLHVASEDYPELSEILVDRPPLAHSERLTMSAGRHDHDSGENDSGDDDSFEGPLQTQAGWGFDHLVAPTLDHATRYLDNKPTQPTGVTPGGANSWSYDWCQFRRNRECYYPSQIDTQATQMAGYAVWTPVDRGVCGRDKWDDQKKCNVAKPGPHSGDPNAGLDATVSWEDGGQRNGVVGSLGVTRLTVEAAFEFTATWNDVRKKATEIRRSGGVRIVAINGDKDSGQTVSGEVRGSTHVYETSITSEPGTYNVALWTCACPWAAYSWGRSGRWKKYEGRMCSHALALTYEVQARGMFGNNVVEDASADWSEDDVFRQGDYIPPTKKAAARMRPVETDAVLRHSAAASIAYSMLTEGHDERVVSDYFGPKIMAEATNMDFKDRLRVLVNGVVKTVRRLVTETGQAILTDGSTVPISALRYPTYSPTEGLGFQSTAVREEDLAVVTPLSFIAGIDDSLDVPSMGDDLVPDGAQVDGETIEPDVDDAALPVTYGDEGGPGDDAQPRTASADADSRSWLLSGSSKASGGGGKFSDADIAAQATATLAKMALKDFSSAEKQSIIDEGIGQRAGNFGDLDVSGTHYDGMYDDDEDDDLDLA